MDLLDNKEMLTDGEIRRIRLQNIFDNAITRGFVSLIWVLSLISFVLVIIVGAVYLAFCQSSGMGVAEALWTAFSFLTNPELPAYSDASRVVPYAVITVVVVIIGLLVTSSLIGIITTALTTYYEGLQRGFSTVLSKGHIAIIGFNDNAGTLISELREAYADEKSLRLVFIDGCLSREEMERRVEGYTGMKLQKLRAEEGLTIICRNGNPRNPEELHRYAVDKAKAIIINDFDDSVILKTLLAVASLLRNEGEDEAKAPTIVCTFRERQFARAASHVGYESSLRVLSLSDTLSNLIAKTCYQPGLSKVLEEVYSFEGSELHFVKNERFDGVAFDDLVDAFEVAIPVGICRKRDDLACGADVLINVPREMDGDRYEKDMTLKSGDELVVLAPDTASAGKMRKEWLMDNPEESNDLNPADSLFFDEPRTVDVGHKSILVIGYDETFDKTIVNLASYFCSVAKGGEVNCSIKLLYRNKREKRVFAARRRFLDKFGDLGARASVCETAHGYDSNLKQSKDILIGSTQVSFQCALSDTIDLPVLERVFLQGEKFDHVIVLSDLAMDREAADTETLLTLLYLRAVAENAQMGKYGEGTIAPFTITSEIQNMENVDLAYNEYVSDYIISWKLIASLQTQIADNRHLYKVLRDLLKTQGSEIQLERASVYIRPEGFENDVDFGALSRHLRSFSEISKRRVLLGYAKSGGVVHVLCPHRDAQGRRLVSLSPDDMLVVIRTT